MSLLCPVISELLSHAVHTVKLTSFSLCTLLLITACLDVMPSGIFEDTKSFWKLWSQAEHFLTYYSACANKRKTLSNLHWYLHYLLISTYLHLNRSKWTALSTGLILAESDPRLCITDDKNRAQWDGRGVLGFFNENRDEQNLTESISNNKQDNVKGCWRIPSVW